MISFLHIDAFRTKLHSLCEEEKFTITTLPPIVEIFQNNKPFLGKIKDDSFSIKKNTRLLPTSYFIEGKFEKFNNITTVHYTLKYNKFLYYAARCGFFVIAGIYSGVILAHGYDDLKKIFNLFLLTSVLTLISIFVDNYRGKELERLFIHEMDLAPNS